MMPKKRKPSQFGFGAGDRCLTIDEKMGQTYVWIEQANTLASRDYKQPQAVLEVQKGTKMSYQKVTGALLASGYNKLGTQEAANDMFVVEKHRLDGKQTCKTLSVMDAEVGVQRVSDKENFDHVIEEEEMEDKTTSIVRRLTPTECCRLQGFPDGWVSIGEWVDTKGKTHKEADSPKYKALGNSIAVGFQNNRSGFWCWLMRRISAQYEYRPTQGSLFSGIGGFDLAWAAVNGPESCRWSSEIEEFPIAVMKQHFGDEDEGVEGDFYQAINGG